MKQCIINKYYFKDLAERLTGDNLKPVSPVEVAAIMFQSFVFGMTRSWSSRFRYSSHLLQNLTGKNGLFEEDPNLLGDTMTPNWEAISKIMICHN